MKSNVIRAAALATTLFSISAAHAQDSHAYALISSDKNNTWFLDLKSVLKGDASTTFWALEADDPSAGKASYSIAQWSIDCINQQISPLYAAEYAADGTLSNSGNLKGSGEAPIVPGTIGEVFANYICKGIDPYPKTGTLADTDKAVAAGHALIEASKKALRPNTSGHHAKNRAVSPSNGGI